MNQAVMDLQNAMVEALVRDIAGEWERIVVNYEMQEEYDGPTEDRLGFYISRDVKQAPAMNDLAFGPGFKELFRTLNEEMQRTGERTGGLVT